MLETVRGPVKRFVASPTAPFNAIFFFFFFFCVPQLYLWGSPLLSEIFAYVTIFLNPTIKVVTFRLRGWCVLGVFFVAGIHPSRT